MKHLILTISLILGATAVSAEEYWACDGFTSARNSGGERFDPFLMKGKRTVGYAFKGSTGSRLTIRYVASNEGLKYDIYIGDTVESYGEVYDDNMKSAYYIKPQGDGSIFFYDIAYDSYLKDKFNGGILAFVTKCYKQ